MRIALAQINNTVGDLDANAEKIIDFSKRAREQGADIVVFPELALTGYPPRDLIEKAVFLDRTASTLQRVAADTAALDLAIVVGYVGRAPHDAALSAQNAAAVLEGGKIIFDQRKMLLPTYDVFDESRYFEPARSQHVCRVKGKAIGLIICEDAWNDKQMWERRRYSRDPVEELVTQGCEILISINASPWNLGKREQRREIFKTIARRYKMPLVYVHMVGGNDQLIFDGSSFALTAQGDVAAAAVSFAEDLVVFDPESSVQVKACPASATESEDEAAYDALVLGTRDYMRKCGFKQVHLGLSGGIDSALVAAIAVDAIGKENVTAVGMPGPYSSDHSLADARSLAESLGIYFEVSSINDGYQAMLKCLEKLWPGRAPDTTEENLQSRLRGLTLMALSNKFGSLVLTTGNKSELAVGYCTLYGDMCGGLAVISDVPKTMVYRLSRIANERRARLGLPGGIPENTFTKPPSAELRPDQKDTDSLPEYEVLDAILSNYIEHYRSAEQIASKEDLPLDLVRQIIMKVDRNEYKRQQAAPGLRITAKAFGLGRRFPIAHRFTE